MDFVTHLPQTSRRHDAVWVIVDQLTKSVHFLTVRMTFTLEVFYRLYIREIVRLHGVPVSIVSNKDPRFTAHFWKSYQNAMGTQLTMSTAFHPQTEGQSERTIQVRVVGKSNCPWWNSPTTTVIKRVYRWRPMRRYMGGHVDLQFVRRRWEKDPSRVWI